MFIMFVFGSGPKDVEYSLTSALFFDFMLLTDLATLENV